MRGMSTAVVCLLTLVVIIHVVGGMHLEPNLLELRCECLQVTSKRYNPKLFQRIDIFPSRNYCPKIEILITMKNGHVVCFSPDAPWINNFLKHIGKKNKDVTKAKP